MKSWQNEHPDHRPYTAERAAWKRAYRQRPEVRERERAYIRQWNMTEKGQAYKQAQLAKARRTPEQIEAARVRHAQLIADRRAAKPPKPAMTVSERDRANEQGRASRAKLRRNAIAALGGVCVWCGYDCEIALEIDHVVPVRRGRNGLKQNDHSGDDTYRDVIRGNIELYQLLCACCHRIKTALVDDKDGLQNVNLEHLEDRPPSPLPLFD